MAFTTKAQLDNAPRTRVKFQANLSVQQAFLNGYAAYQLNATGNVAEFGVATAAAIGAGGALMGNGSAGFPVYPAEPTSISKFSAWSGAAIPQCGYLYDVIWMASGIAANSTAAQTVVGFPALTRPDVNGTGLELFVLTRTAATGGIATTVTVSYTNSAGVAGRSATLRLSATLLGGFSANGWLFPLRLQTGDVGVQSVQSITLGSAQTSAGDVWLVLARRLAQVAVRGAKAAYGLFDAYSLGLPPIGPNAAVLYVAGNGNTTVTAQCELEFAHG